jgi:hypothetical protein
MILEIKSTNYYYRFLIDFLLFLYFIVKKVLG